MVVVVVVAVVLALLLLVRGLAEHVDVQGHELVAVDEPRAVLVVARELALALRGKGDSVVGARTSAWDTLGVRRSALLFECA